MNRVLPSLRIVGWTPTLAKSQIASDPIEGARRGRPEVLGGPGLPGSGRTVRVPFRGRRLKRWKRRHNSTHAKVCCIGEQAMATLKGWRLPRRLRCSTNRITVIVKAVVVLHHTSS
ncbi:hypothetical protein GCM10017779_62030 [Streptomyces capillispiralis]|nr:hypothetical protein GCM10017779_62030 [Streptomyces capillispiralis]